MNELLGIFQKNKTRKLSKDDKVLTNKLKFVYFVSFIFFMKLRLSFYLLYEVKTFYFSCYPFRKPPE